MNDDVTNGESARTRPPVVLLTDNIESRRVLTRRGVTVTVTKPGRRGAVGDSPSVVYVGSRPSAWDASFDSWYESVEWPAGAVMVPGNDQSAWWMGRRHDQGEASSVRLATPGLSVVRSILMKHRLWEICRQHEVPTPGSWLVEGDEVPPAVRAEAVFPVVLKPQCRVGNKHWTRGRVAQDESELAEAIHWFRQTVQFDEHIIADDPAIIHPIVQEYVTRPGHEVYHLVGYRSKDGESVVAAHRKILQYPRGFGNGLCFESAPVDAEAAAKLETLLAAVGFHGIFEAEYVERAGEKLLIDLNPRAYNGLGLETQRGYDLPWYLYLDSIGEHELLSRELAEARALTPPKLIWRDGVRFWTMLATQTLCGGMGLRETRRWMGWSRANRGRMVDPFFVAGDRKAGIAHLRHHLTSMVTDPRTFAGTYFRRRLND